MDVSPEEPAIVDTATLTSARLNFQLEMQNSPANATCKCKFQFCFGWQTGVGFCPASFRVLVSTRLSAVSKLLAL